MSSRRLLTGGAASGKTAAAIELLAGRYRSSTFTRALVLVPTSRHGDQFRQRLVAQCGVAFNLAVQTPAQLSASILGDAGVRIASSEVVEALLERCVLRLAEAGALGYFSPLAKQRGLIGLVSRELDQLFAELVDPREFARAASGDDRLSSLATVYSELSASLESAGLVHRLAAPHRAAASGVDEYAAVVVDGFRTFSAAEVALVSRLVSGAGDAMVTFDPEAGTRAAHDVGRLIAALPADTEPHELDRAAPATGLRAAAAAGREDVVRRVARHFKELLAADPSLRPSALAVGVRQTRGYVRLVRQVFAEFDLPLDVAAAEPLAQRPFGAWLGRLTRLGNPEWKLSDLLSVLRSDYFDRGSFDLNGARLGAIADSARRVHAWGGDDLGERIVAALEDLPGDPPEWLRELRTQAGNGLTRAMTVLRTVATPPMTRAGHAAALEARLFGPGGIVPARVRAEASSRAEIDTLRGLLGRARATEEVVPGGDITFAEFADWLRRAMERPAVQIREAGGVLLAPIHTLHGLRFAHVAVLGLVDGEFPAPRSMPPLMGVAQRDHLAAMGLQLTPAARATESELWADVRTRADVATVGWRTRFDEKRRERAPSTFYGEAEAGGVMALKEPAPATAASRREQILACVRSWPASSSPAGFGRWANVREGSAVERLRRSFSPAGASEGMLTGTGLALTDESTVWSATQLESYLTCPFQHFAGYVLRLGEVEQEMDEPDAAVVGQVVHQILREVVEPLVDDGQPLTLATLPGVLAKLPDVAREKWDEAVQTHGFMRKGLWAVRLERTVQEIAHLLKREANLSADLGVTRVFAVEHEFNEDLPTSPPMRFRGSIDRLDSGPGFAVVVDYKSSSQMAIKEVTDPPPKRIQLQLYGEIAREKLGVERLVGRYALLRPKTNARFEIDSAKSTGPFEAALDTAAGIARATSSGEFPVFPSRTECPTYCAFKDACRVNHYSRLKWPDD